MQGTKNGVAISFEEMTNEQRQLLNRCAREEMKLKLLLDIRNDLQICEIEGWDKKEYLSEIKKLINSFNV